MLAHGRDTWGEAAEIVIKVIAGYPGDPVNAWAFTDADIPSRPQWAGRGGKGNLFQFKPETSICIRLPADVIRHTVRLTGLGLAPSPAAATVLAVARRLDPEGRRYRPEARP